MSRQKAVFLLVVIALAAVTAAVFYALPKHYTEGQQLQQEAVFWNDHDAFIFLALNTSGRSRNVLQEKLAGSKYLYLNVFLVGFQDFSRPEVVAYHLGSSGQLDRFTLPDHTVVTGFWTLADGKLELVPPASAAGWIGTRWDGEKFEPVTAPAKSKSVVAPGTKLSPDGEGDDDDEAATVGLPAQSDFQALKRAGWHHKFLFGYSANGGEATLPMQLGKNSYELTLESAPYTHYDAFDPLTYGARSVKISGEKVSGASPELWTQKGWQPIAKADYERDRNRYGTGRVGGLPSWGWLVAVLVIFGWRFGHWFYLIFNVASVKRRVLNTMATSYSFPPASTTQYPMLDLDALERYTREFEALGFARLLDFSLVSNAGTNQPSFCRLMAHTRYHCWAEVGQIFPRGKSPMALKCSIQSCLQNGWTLTFSDRKPQAASSLIRRKKGISVCMPEITTGELLQAFLKMRDQVCIDLGVSVLNDDSMEAYIAKVQRQAGEMREAVEEKNFLKGIPEVYARRISLLKTKPEYVWLGDYPKETEQRKQGFGTLASSSTMDLRQ